MSEEPFSFDPEVTAERASDEPALIVDVEGFEGPLDLLLILARQQKVDLAKISILALADQYLAFIEAARQLRRRPSPLRRRPYRGPRWSRSRGRRAHRLGAARAARGSGPGGSGPRC